MNEAELMQIKSLEKLDAADSVELGEWFLLDKTKEDFYYSIGRYGEENEVFSVDGRALVCSDTFESNLVVFKNNCKEYRVLNKNLGTVITPISQIDAISLIQQRITQQQSLRTDARDKILEIIAIISMSGTSQSKSTEVAIATKNAIMQQSTAIKEVHAKNIEAFNEEIKSHVATLHEITRYYALPATVGMAALGRTKGFIDEKMHELNLYGGLDEKQVDIATGGVVNESVPIHIFQNLKYMDVEAIIGYENGGIGLEDVATFNKWLAIPENRDRILPESKSIIAIKTRKYREFNIGSFVPENKTYLYMRNGENIRSLSTNLPISGTLLATESEVGGDVYVKKRGSSPDMSRNFLFLSKHEFDTLTDRAESYKPLWLNILLSAYKEKLKYFNQAIDYVKHRQQVLGERYDRSERLIIRSGDRSNTSYRPQSEKEFQESISKQLGAIEGVKTEIETIKGCIKNGFSDPYLGMPMVYEAKYVLLADNECGFVDRDGTKHLMVYSMSDYHDKLIELTRSFDVAELYTPNRDSDGGYKTDPYSILRVLDSYSLMNEDNYFFDDLKRISWQKYKRQNDLAVLIQGVLDRSTFFGYTKANLFKDGYEDKIKLVHDKDKGLYDGDMPDFKSFIKKCNVNSKAGDLFVGQQALWAQKEREKQQVDRFYDTISMPKILPAYKITNKRDGSTVVIFRWETDRDWYSQAKSSTRVHRFECDIRELMNISHYKLGDCKPFAGDPRCRDLYPKWGDLIMTAERHHQKHKA